MSSLILRLFMSIPLLWSQLVFAEGQVATKTLSSSPVTSGVLLETLLGLILVLIIIVFLAWLLRKSGQFQSSSTGDLFIISSLTLGPRERAVLLQVGEQQLLVGVTPQHIQTLHVLEKNIESNKNTKVTPRFAERLQQMMQQRGES